MSATILTDEGRAITLALALPFEESEVKFKPQVVKNNRALALAYVDARVIMDRLDDVLGVACWQDTYDILADGSVQCRLRIRVNDRWITKTDVGSPSEQPDGGDRLKAAFSDALKRAAVKYGVGRYLYRMPQQWADYDSVKKQFVSPPKIPAWALPEKAPTAPAQASPAPVVATPPEKKATEKKTAEKKTSTDISGPEFHRRLREADAELAQKGACPLGSLLAHITQAGLKAGFGPNLDEWTKPAIELAVTETRTFKARLANRSAESKTAA
ncbi:Rad52/Rad22 family DNA repair protein [Zavarzinella formosa]|uniref:Rad52/Rad22 family DNA repair protein n=1 Tax=Zavarzinella formosa TaxID=360055 RepID=UPI0012F81A2E|nr:Rad52/Rad22 family DNA repair protein [Zavarzinella formosa]